MDQEEAKSQEKRQEEPMMHRPDGQEKRQGENLMQNANGQEKRQGENLMQNGPGGGEEERRCMQGWVGECPPGAQTDMRRGGNENMMQNANGEEKRNNMMQNGPGGEEKRECAVSGGCYDGMNPMQMQEKEGG